MLYVGHAAFTVFTEYTSLGHAAFTVFTEYTSLGHVLDVPNLRHLRNIRLFEFMEFTEGSRHEGPSGHGSIYTYINTYIHTYIRVCVSVFVTKLPTDALCEYPQSTLPTISRQKAMACKCHALPSALETHAPTLETTLHHTDLLKIFATDEAHIVTSDFGLDILVPTQLDVI